MNCQNQDLVEESSTILTRLPMFEVFLYVGILGSTNTLRLSEVLGKIGSLRLDRGAPAANQPNEKSRFLRSDCKLNANPSNNPHMIGKKYSIVNFLP